MNSVFCIGYLILIQTVNVVVNLEYNRHANIIYSNQGVHLGYPFYFGYKNGQFLNMIIILKNFAPNVDIRLAHVTGLYVQPIETAESNAKSFHCSGNLYTDRIWVHVEIHTNSILCERKIITEGINLAIPMTWGTSYEPKYNESCLIPSQPCIIEVDLKNGCGDNYYYVNAFQRSGKMLSWIDLKTKLWNMISLTNRFSSLDKPIPITPKCHRQSALLICTSHTDIQGVIYQMWYHDYGDQKRAVGLIPPLQARSTRLIMTLEKFDNDTDVYNTLTSTTLNKEWTTKRRKIYIYANESGQDLNVTTLKYGLKLDVLFDCRDYLNQTEFIQVGHINTANKISTYDQKWVKKKFNMADNGTILCCLLHRIYNGDTETQVERFVLNKNMLMYDESLDFIPSGQNLDTTTLKYFLKEKVLFDCQNCSSTTESVADSPSIYEESFVYIIITIVVVIAALFLIISIYIVKCYRKNSNPEQSLELNTYSSPILYADLNFAGGEVQIPTHENESTYAEIIGVLKPFQEK